SLRGREGRDFGLAEVQLVLQDTREIGGKRSFFVRGLAGPGHPLAGVERSPEVVRAYVELVAEDRLEPPGAHRLVARERTVRLQDGAVDERPLEEHVVGAPRLPPAV